MWKRPFLITLTVVLTLGALMLISCGQQGGAGTGTLGVLLKDAHTVDILDPVDGSSLTATQMWVTIQQIALEAEADQWLSVFDASAINPDTGQPYGSKSLDLLSLHTTADLLALADVPVGSYEKVRLILDTTPGANYFCTGSDPTPCADPDRYDLKVPSGKVDLELKPHLVVPEGGTVDLLLDFIPDQSIHIVQRGQSGKEYLLRPEILVFLVNLDQAPSSLQAQGGLSLEEFEGVVLALDCRSTPPTLMLAHEHGRGVRTVDLSEARIYDPQARVIACGDIPLDARVEIKGTLRLDGALVVQVVKVKRSWREVRDFASGHPEDHPSDDHDATPSALRVGEWKGIILDVTATDTGVTLTLSVRGGVQTYTVQVDTQTSIKDERGSRDILAAIQDLDIHLYIEVEGFLQQDGTIVAREVEIKA